MLKTKFGKRLFSLVLVLVSIFALVGCQTGEDPSVKAIADATAKAEEIKTQLIWDKTAMNQVTAAVKGFITKTKYSNVTVAWESSAPDVLDTTGKVTRPNFDDERAIVAVEATETEPAIKVVPVVMTATITAVAEWEINGKTYSKEIEVEKEFKFTITTVAEGTKVGTIAEVKAAAAKYIYDEKGVQRELVSNSSVVYNASVVAVVTAKLNASGSGQFMIHDGTEGIYVYTTLDGLEVGDKVSVVGEIYSYYGALQFGSNISVSVVEKGAGLDAEYRSTTPQELETEGAERNDKGLVKAGYYGGELVNVYGLLVNEAATGGSSDKYHVADAKTGEKLWIYYKSYDADMEAKLQEYVGKYVNLRGVTYDRDSRLQKNEILWDGTIEEAAAPTLTDADKVTVALAAINVPAQAEADFELAAGEGYVWEIVSGSSIAIENGVAKVTRGETDDVVTLKVTVTVGEASDSKEFEVKVPAAKLNIITIAEALALASTKEHNTYTEDKYYVQGIITELASDKYGNCYIEDATGKLYVYGIYSADGATRYDGLEAKPQVGDLVTLYGVLGTYNNATQMKSGWLAEYYDVVTIAEGIELGGTEKNVYTEAKYALQGVITEVQNDIYGNVVISDGTDSILIYGMYDAKGNRYDALEYKPQVGDFVTVYGVLGYYNAAQMKNATLIETINPYSTAGLTANAVAREHNIYTETLYYAKGVVTEVKNATYGNIYVQDETGTIYVYGLYSADGSTRYDAMEVKPQVGDTVIVRGMLGNYNGTAQLKNAQLIVLTAGSGETPEPHEHEFVNGKCSCGEEDPNYVAPEAKEVTCAEAATLDDGTPVILKGTIHTVDSAWNEQYSNMDVTLKDETGTFYLFRLATKVVAGDIVTVTGVIGSYNETKQLAQGGTAEITGHDASYDKVPEEGAVTIAFDDVSRRTEFDTKHQVWEQNGIKVINNKSESTSNVGDYFNPARFYASSSLTIEYTANIEKIVITTAGGKNFSEDLAIEGCTVTVVGTSCTIVLNTPATSVTIAKLAAQVRVSTIEVYAAK